MINFAPVRGLLAAVFFLSLASCSHVATVQRVEPSLPAAAVRAQTEQTAAGDLTRRAKHRTHRQTLAGYLELAASAASGLAENPRNEESLALYNYTTARVISLLEKLQADLSAGPYKVPATDGGLDWSITFLPPYGQPVNFLDYELIPTDELKLGGQAFQSRSVRAGLGAPIVAVGKNASEAARETHALPKACAGETVVTRFGPDRRVVLDFRDPLSQDTIALGGHTFPLAADFSAPVAYLISRDKPYKLGIVRLLRPARYRDTARLVRLQSYDRTKIPLVLVHGLQDTPATWAWMINGLLADEVVRKNYQIWVFSYPSGYPFPYSAALLRTELDDLARIYPRRKSMVLVGHSMGGLLARLMMTETGHTMWDSTFNKRPEELDIPEDSLKTLTESLYFTPREDLARVVFFSTPHRGSDLATRLVGRLGSMLVVIPDFLTDVAMEFQDLVNQDFQGLKLRRLPNSIDTLSPRSGVMKALDALPPETAGIPYHSVIGDRGRGDTPNSSDGVVPYWSSHVEGAASEEVVPSGHGAHRAPEGIRELRRILREHADRP